MLRSPTPTYAQFAIALVLLGSLAGLGSSEASAVPPVSYDARYDHDHDGDIDVADVQVVAGHWGGSGAWSGSCSEIQAAIDGLPAQGGQVIVQAGTYLCSEPIVIDRDNVALRGQGPATLLRLSDNANSPVIVAGQISTPPTEIRSRIHISNLSIDGNRQNQAFECWGGPCDTGGLTAIRNNGITLRAVHDGVVDRVSVTGARSGGLVTEKGCRRLRISHFDASDNFFDGLAAYETEDSLFSGLTLRDNLAAGLSLDIHFDHNILSDGVISGSGTVGVFMRDSRDNLFQGWQMRDSGQHGVFIAQVDTNPATAATGNTFDGLMVSGSGGAGFRANDASCVDNLVVASQFAGNLGGCISEAQAGQVQTAGVICC